MESLEGFEFVSALGNPIMLEIPFYKKNLMMVLQMKLFLGFAVFFVACFTSLQASAQKLTPVFSLWAASCCDGCGIKCSC